MMRWLIVSGMAFLLLAPFLGCATPESRAQKSHIKELKRREYEITREVFIVKYEDDGTLALEIPGKTSAVPISIESYRKYGKRWATDPLYKQANRIGSFHTEVLAIVTVGTRFRITKLREEPFIIPYWEIYGQLELPPFDRCKVNIIDVFDEDGLFTIQPKEGYAKEVVKEND